MMPLFSDASPFDPSPPVNPVDLEKLQVLTQSPATTPVRPCEPPLDSKGSHLLTFAGNSPGAFLDWLLEVAEGKPLIVLHQDHGPLVSPWDLAPDAILLTQSKQIPVLSCSKSAWRKNRGLAPGTLGVMVMK